MPEGTDIQEQVVDTTEQVVEQPTEEVTEEVIETPVVQEPVKPSAPPEVQQLLDIAKGLKDENDRLRQQMQPQKPVKTMADRFKARGITDEATIKLLGVASEEMRDALREEILNEIGPLVVETHRNTQDRSVLENLASEASLSKADQTELARMVAEMRQSDPRANAATLHYAALGRLRAKTGGDASKLAEARAAKLRSQGEITDPKNRPTTLVPDKMKDDEYEKLSWEEKVRYFHSLNKGK
jgi:hypothetical protein